MNLLLFEDKQERYTLPLENVEAQHVLHVLKLKEGDTLFVGAINNDIGKSIVSINKHNISLKTSWEIKPPPLSPITILVGIPRPQTARKILQELTSIGVAHMIFFSPDKGEPNYKQSKLWTTNEWRRHLILGAEQAFSTALPEVTHADNLLHAIELAKKENSNCIALDNYEATIHLKKMHPRYSQHILAIGSERGWSTNERNILRSNQFTLAHLGQRVLRTETACIIGASQLI